MKSKTCIAILLSALVSTANAQTRSKPLTKIFFEYGFTNCLVKVLNNKNVLFKGNLTSVSKRSGATEIVEISRLRNLKVTINACCKTKVLNIQKSKFYRISIINNVVIVKEVDEEPVYVITELSRIINDIS